MIALDPAHGRIFHLLAEAINANLLRSGSPPVTRGAILCNVNRIILSERKATAISAVALAIGWAYPRVECVCVDMTSFNTALSTARVEQIKLYERLSTLLSMTRVSARAVTARIAKGFFGAWKLNARNAP